MSGPFLSDPDLVFHEQYQVAISTGHPQAKTYPKKAFLQPAVFMWTPDGELAFEWRATPGLLNLYGALRRMSLDAIVKKADQLLTR